MKRRLLIVGAFPPEGTKIFGGHVRVCNTLLSSGLHDEFEIKTIDSTQKSNPPPRLLRRATFAVWRLLHFTIALGTFRPAVCLIFTQTGASFAEKSLMGWIARFAGSIPMLFPRGGALIDTAERSKISMQFVRIASRGSCYFLCQGQRWHEFATCRLGFSPSHAPIVPNWTATPDLLTIGSNRQGRQNSEVLRLLYVGWVEEFKGINELLRSFNDLYSKRQNVRLTIAGDGHALADAKSFVRHNNLASVVTFAGWIEIDRLKLLLSESDIFVFPSWQEGLPNAVIEAFAAGLAVIATDVGVLSDFVTPGEEALLVQPKNQVELNEAIEQTVANKALRDSLGKNAHKLAKQAFSIDNAVSVLAPLINDVSK